MDDGDWLRLCVYEEARGDGPDGQAAVARVVMNRTALHYSSSGSIVSTVTWPSQFSWCEFDWRSVVDPKTRLVRRRYVRVCSGATEIRARAQDLIAAAQRDARSWAGCCAIADAARRGVYASAQARAMTPDTVLYANLALVSPAWALKLPRVATIGHQAFFRDPRAGAPGPVEAVAPHQLAATPADSLIDGARL